MIVIIIVQMFAFVRFTKGVAENIVQALCQIRIGSLCLHANLARHPRQHVVKFVSYQKFKPTSTQWKHVLVSGSTYANVVEGHKNGTSPKVSEAAKQASSFSLDGEHLNDIVYPNALLGCYRDFKAIANAKSMCYGEGFPDVQPMYLGGLWVLFDFNSELACDKFLNNSACNTWFEVLKKWHNDFVVDESHMD